MPTIDIATWDERLLDGVNEAAPWSADALRARRYYHNHQWDDASDLEVDDRIHITNNVIKRDIDYMWAQVMEADPVMETHGRGSEDFKLGDVWKDLLRWSEEWTGYIFDSVMEVRRRVIMDMFQTGEGYEKVWWSPDEENGLGMVVSEHVDSLNLLWDKSNKSVQWRSSPWIIQFDPIDIDMLKAEFPKFGEIKPDYPDRFISGLEQAPYSEYQALIDEGNTSGSVPASSRRVKKAYRIECWEKKESFVPRFYMKRSTRMAMMPEVDENTGQVRNVPMDEAYYGRLDEGQKDKFYQRTRRTYELSKGVMINKEWAERPDVSEYDESKNGHGEYPYARYSNSYDPTQSHAHGEIEGLIGMQDSINRATSRWLESLFIANAVFLAIQKGAAPKGELAKLEQIGARTLQQFHYYPGQPIPEFVNTNPGSAQLFEAGIRTLMDFKDGQSSVRNINRAAPEYDLSGVAIQQLQAPADLIAIGPRMSVESGMRQATTLRIACMMKYMRGARQFRITPKADRDPYSIYAGEDEATIKAAFSLEDQTRPVQVNGRDTKVNTGSVVESGDMASGEGKILELSDEGIRKFDLRLQLDSGREAKKAERRQMVTTFLSYLGPAAGVEVVKWAASIMDVPDVMGLVTALDKEDQKAQAVQMIEQAQKQTGMSFQEMVQIATATLAAQKGGRAPRGNGQAPQLQPQAVT